MPPTTPGGRGRAGSGTEASCSTLQPRAETPTAMYWEYGAITLNPGSYCEEPLGVLDVGEAGFLELSGLQ